MRYKKNYTNQAGKPPFRILNKLCDTIKGKTYITNNSYRLVTQMNDINQDLKEVFTYDFEDAFNQISNIFSRMVRLFKINKTETITARARLSQLWAQGK